MLALLYAYSLFGVLQHGIYGPMGFAVRYCGVSSGAVKTGETVLNGSAKRFYCFSARNWPWKVQEH